MRRYPVAFALLSLFTVASPISGSAATIACAGLPADVVGTAADDTLTGTPGPDVIAGLEGADTIDGLGGDDVICGGPGNDAIFGGAGHDTVLGERGRDRILGGFDDDRLRGGGGNDRLNGGTGNDRLLGGPGTNNRARGGPGADRCWDSLLMESCLLGLQLQLVAALPPGHGAGLAVSPPADERIFLIDQSGPIRVISASGLQPTPLLDLTGQVATESEQGVLGLAFHPDYAHNGRVFVFFTQLDRDLVIAEWIDDGDWPLDASDGNTVIEIDHSERTNHNGGMVQFGPDGYLYAAIGDGGTGGAAAQNLSSLLGKILRLDVDSGSPYAIPPGNPFVGAAGADEIWAYGLRNPWRFAFDPADGLVYVADVGQARREEVSVITEELAGANFGWDILEGSLCYSPSVGCSSVGTVLPVHEELHIDAAGSCSIIGGFVYRGSNLPELIGHYFFGDFCAGYVRTLRHDGASAVDLAEWLDLDENLTSFGVDAAGELYVATITGHLYRLAPVR